MKEIQREAFFIVRHRRTAIFLWMESALPAPFLCRYGSNLWRQKRQVAYLAAVQIQNFIQYGMDGKTGLPYHGYECESGIKYGIIGWAGQLDG